MRITGKFYKEGAYFIQYGDKGIKLMSFHTSIVTSMYKSPNGNYYCILELAEDI